MVAHIKTLAFLGVDAVAVDVQVHLAPGHKAFTVVGLPDADGQSLLDRIADTKKLSARGFNRILRVAHTLAGLDHSDMPGAENIATAIRRRDVTI